MTGITLRILDGADRGRTFDNLQPPVTIGREEGNTIQLNDERVSRFHVKIQHDHDQLVLTDLESTNGTKVNGEDIQLRILRFGDLISVGRSVLLFGSRDQIAERLAKLREADDANATRLPTGDVRPPGSALDFELNFGDDPDAQAALHLLEPPRVPERLSPGQAAQLSELLEFLHVRIRHLLSAATTDDVTDKVTLSQRHWQYLIDLQSRLSEYLRLIGHPDE
jgi:pSer/pThr/pTyr-binding forkhead associated (FHA) protein